MKKILFGLSIIFLSFSFFMVMYLSQNWEIVFIEYLYGVSLFTPIFLNVLSIVSAYLSVNGATRKVLVYLNFLMIIYFGILSFIGLYGFQEP